MSDMMTAADVEQARKRSVTRQDAIPATASAPFTILMGPVGLLSGIPGIAQYGQFALPPPGSIQRDQLLSQTPGFETMWAALIFKLISKKVAQGFRIEDAEDSQRRIKAAQQLILGYDGSYASGLQRGLQDYLLTDMGMVVEKARQSSARGSKIAGLFHLDALRCYPTGDPNKPIVYWSYYGGYHLLDVEDVIRITDLPSPRVEMRGYGFCAASRAWATILKLAAVEVYFREKITGTRNLAIHLVNGVSDKMLRDALNTSDDAREQRGFVLYKGSTIVPMIEMAATPTVVTIPLAEVPDGFNVTEERTDAYRRYAHSAGANVEDFVPAPAGLNTGLSTQIRDEALAGQGMAAFDKNWELALTHTTLPGSTTFYMGTGDDWRDQEMQAKAQKARADKLEVYVRAGAISPLQMLNAAVDAGDLDQAFLPADVTEQGNIDDNEKLIGGEAQAAMPVVTPLPSNTPQAAGGGQQKEVKMKECRACGDHSPANALYCSFCDQPFGVVKDVDTTRALVNSESDRAIDWARKARGDG
jgi:hypothetical protein